MGIGMNAAYRMPQDPIIVMTTGFRCAKSARK
jgi:hypothetical protein